MEGIKPPNGEDPLYISNIQHKTLFVFVVRVFSHTLLFFNYIFGIDYFSEHCSPYLNISELISYVSKIPT